MKNSKRKIACLLTTFIFLFAYIATTFHSIDAYAENYKEYIVASSSSSKPKSGGFSSGGSKSFSTKPKSTTIKPDSGGFSSKPSNSSSKSNSSSSVKPDSGSFSTKPKNDNSNSNKKYNDYDDDRGSNSSRPIFGGSNYGGYYGGYSPFHRIFYGFGVSSWITKVVVIITVAVIAYIIFDYIRSRRN
ncbi:hypothetical protein [[Clostridium] dakarense]|uniref:hypothetical protein n=1 Tax=Faecalimicrobium dakarense TaxID=1301100 RepID=UPI0004BC6531|nr:hypothetical protein [[Clostridium] dakarense]